MAWSRARNLGVLLAAIGGLATYACSGRLLTSATSFDGGSVSDAGSPGAADSGCLTRPAGPPLQHRASAVACGLSASNESCTSDAGCDAVPSAKACRPYPDAGGATFCTADKCFTDDDCPNLGPCECSLAAAVGVLNRCSPGNCHTDADCASGGFCSLSPEVDCSRGGSSSGGYGGGGLQSAAGYYCHSPKDACTNDSDCAPCGTGAYCAMTEIGLWQCIGPAQLPTCSSG